MIPQLLNELDILRYDPNDSGVTLPMLKTLWAIVRQGKIELLEQTEIPEGARILVTFLPDDESEFWLQTSRVSLDAIWDNREDDIYAQLLQK